MAGNEENPWHKVNTDVEVLKATVKQHGHRLDKQDEGFIDLRERVERMDDKLDAAQAMAKQTNADIHHKLDNVVHSMNIGQTEFKRMLEAHIVQEAQDFKSMATDRKLDEQKRRTEEAELRAFDLEQQEKQRKLDDKSRRSSRRAMHLWFATQLLALAAIYFEYVRA